MAGSLSCNRQGETVPFRRTFYVMFGVDVMHQFHKLFINISTNYFTMISTYPEFYEEVDEVIMLQANIQIFRFILLNIFKGNLPDQALLSSLSVSAKCFPDGTDKWLSRRLLMG